MNPEYVDLLARIEPLDLPTLTHLEADIAILVQKRQFDEGATPKRGLDELLAKAHESLSKLDPKEYWEDRERELSESKASWNSDWADEWRG